MASQIDRFDRNAIYNVEGTTPRALVVLMERLYEERRMNADEMRDWANSLYVHLNSFFKVEE